MKKPRASLKALAASAAAALLWGCASAPKQTVVINIPDKNDSTAAPSPGPRPQSHGKYAPSPAAQAPGAKPGEPAKTAQDSAKGKASAAAKSASPNATSSAPRAAEPLIMENANSMEGYRSRGEYILSGKVAFSHGTLRLETERAVWQKDRNMVYCESGMRIKQKGATLTSDKGSYDKTAGLATAEGNVRMRDSAGEVEATGRTVTYNRPKHLTTLAGSPELRRYYRVKDDSAGHRGAPRDSITDTLVIQGRNMTYDDSLQVAVAEGAVRIRRDRMNINCARAEYHEQADSLYLIGEPQVQVDDSKVKGQIMRLGMHGEEIRSLLVKGAAQANSLEPATDTTVARQSKVEGDSLFLAFKEKAIDSVQVFRHANGSYYDVDKPEYVNKMAGEYMVLRFAGRQIHSADVMGSAKSTYYHFEAKKLKGRNDAQGDTIAFAFKEGKIDEVLVRGNAKGTYFGDAGKKKKAAAADSAKAAPVGPSAATKADSAATPAAAKPAARPAQAAAAKPQPAPAQPAEPKKTVIKPWGRK